MQHGREIINPKKIVLIDSAGLKPKRSLKYYLKIYTFKLRKEYIKNITKYKKSTRNERKFSKKI